MPTNRWPTTCRLRWRRRLWPQLQPALRCNSILAVAQAGALRRRPSALAPRFLLQDQPGIVALTGNEPALDTELWLLTPPRRAPPAAVKVFFDFVRQRLVLP